MDLSTLDTTKAADAGAVMLVTHPVTRKPVLDEETKEQLWIRLRGADSREAVTEAHANSLRRAERQRSAIRGGRDEEPETVEEIERRVIDTYVKLTVDWGPKWIVDGKSLPCTPENARIVFSRFRWLREQADVFIYDRSHYLGN